MKTNIPFELTNEQRKYLGLSLVGDTWELVYFAGQYLYYDGNIIRKKITISDDGSYYEAELYEITAENRTVLLPKTKRGKPKKMNYTATLSFRPFGVYFRFSANQIIIANYTTQTTFYHEDPQSYLSLKEWLSQWISETTEEELEEIELYKNAKRQHIKYREGDFFVFKIGRKKWGFGRIVLNIAERRKSATFKVQKNYGLTHLMGKPLYIMVYRKIAETTDVDINEFALCGTFPVQAIMDNKFYYGEYKIIGNQSIMAEEWEPIISYSRSINDTVYLQYGLIFKETTIDIFDKYLIDSTGEISPYRNEGICFGIYNYSIIENLVNGNEIEPPTNVPYSNRDLRAPENIDIKREIFTFFGLDANKSYAENLKLEINK